MIHRAENRQYFTVVDGKAVNDNRLSFDALGLLVRMLSMSDEWEFSVGGLMARYGIGQSKLTRCIRELKEAGYLEIKQVKNEAGVIVSYTWDVYETSHNTNIPYMENPHVENPHMEKPCYGKPTCGKPGLITNNNITNINKTNIKGINIKEAHGEFSNVKLSQEEFTKLADRLGTEERDGLIEELSCYLRNHPNKYKDHYATILSWARKRSQGNAKRAKAEPINPFDELLKKEGYT